MFNLHYIEGKSFNKKMIKLINISKTFHLTNGKNYKVFESINYTFNATGKYAILGKNGSGKSTLINLICGIQKPDKGGKIIKTVRVSWPVGFGGNFQGSLTGRQNIEFICDIFGKPINERMEIIEYCRTWTELESYFDEPIKNYSSGMKARLGFASSIAFDFDFYIMDEVTATGDMFFTKKAKQELMRKLQNKGCIIVSHALNDIAGICDHFAVMKEQKLTFYENLKEALFAYKN